MADDIIIRTTANTELLVERMRQWYIDAVGVMQIQLGDELEEVLQDIKDNYVPIGQPPKDPHPGQLRDTGRVEPVVFDADGNLTTGITFGDEQTPYARIQHEDLTYHHTHGQAKYIEVPLRKYVESKKS